MQSSNHPARKIKQLLKTYSMTVQEVSEKLGITLESLREILDERAMPTAHLLRRISSMFGVGEAIFDEFLPSPSPASGRGRDDFEFPAGGAKPAAALPFKGKSVAGAGPGRSIAAGKGTRLRRQKKLDLAEIYIRQQVLFELLMDKKVFTRDEYQMRMEIIRAKILERRAAKVR
jgi:transcriptional regulator with XRE-family HTH domain